MIHVMIEITQPRHFGGQVVQQWHNFVFTQGVFSIVMALSEILFGNKVIVILFERLGINTYYELSLKSKIP